ncbi:DUF4118 domain-containing protein [Chromobacterium haemolyticum]|nr:DUF4118 domain-containing protein [Chromobacterium haemolyticum]
MAHEQEDASANAAAKTGGSLLFEDQDSPRSRFGYLAAFVACLLTTALAGLLIPHVALANDIMIYLVVVLVSVRYGRGPGMLASLLSVASFDFFFVPPHMSFAVSDTQYLMTFVVMLLVASIISQLTARLRFEANISTYRERRTRALYDLGRELAGALTAAQIVDTAVSRLEPLFAAKVSLFLPNSGGTSCARPARAAAMPISASRNGFTTISSRPAWAPTPCPPTPRFMCRCCAPPCATAA